MISDQVDVAAETAGSDDSAILESIANAGESLLSVVKGPEHHSDGLITYKAKRLDSTTPIPGIEATVGDYWSWAHSDIMENTQRGGFAEFLVARVLGRSQDIRVGWTGYDAEYRSQKIEVKSSAYIQSWPLRQYSRIVFGFQRRRQWYPESGQMSEALRVADIYVFAHYFEMDADSANVLDVSKWQFFVASTQTLVRAFGESANTLTLKQVEQVAPSTSLLNLKRAIDQAIDLLQVTQDNSRQR